MSKKTEAAYRTIVSAALDGFWILDIQGRFLDVNDYYCRLMGYSRDELMNMSITDVEAIEEPDETAARIERIVERGWDRFETRHRRKDGRVVDFEVSVRFLSVEGGRLFAFLRDVTERKRSEERRERRAEKALLNSEEMYRTLFNASPDAIIVSGTDDTITKVSSKAVEMLGYESEDEITGRNVFGLFAPEEREKAAENRRMRFEGRPTGFVEYTMLKKDGTLLDVELSATAFHDSTGNPKGVIGIARDITERKRMEQALKDEKDFIETALDALQDGFFVLSVEAGGKLIRWNKMFADATGYTDEELSNMTVLDFFDDEGKRKQEDFLLELLAEGKGRIEFEVITKDGRRVPHEGRSTLVKDSEGIPCYVCGVARDITERKLAEEAVRRSEEKYRSLFESSKDGIVVAGFEGKIIEANQAYLDMLGYTLDEIREISYERLTPNNWHQKEMEIARDQILKRGYSDEYEKEDIRKDGTVIPVGIRRWLITDEHGKPTGMWAIVRDISERKRAERDLQRANTELEEFAHSVSHDLRAPFFASSLAVEILQELYKSPWTDENLQYISEAIDTIDHSLSKSSALVEDLLSHAKAGMKPVEVADVDVGTVVQTVLEEKAGSIAEKGIEVVVAADLGHVVASDTQIYQIFANLIGNAVKYIDSASPVIEISYLGDDGKGGHRYLVRDNGYGIPPEHLGKVFIPFFTGETGETGIGLSTVEKIVRVYEGEIKAYNDNGACFEFTIRDFQEDQAS